MIIPSADVEYVEVSHLHPEQTLPGGGKVAFMPGFTYFGGVRTPVEVALVTEGETPKVYWRRKAPSEPASL